LKEKIKICLDKTASILKKLNTWLFKGSKSKIILNIVGILLCIIFIPMLLFNTILIIKGVARPDEVPSIFKISPMIVQSGSMEDEILKGDLIFVKKIDIELIEVNDIIAYRESTYVVTHRIIDIKNEDGNISFKTKGDANTTADRDLVASENVVGIYVGRIAKMGDLAMFLQSPLGMIVFIGIPILIYIIFDLLRRQLESKKAVKTAGSPYEIISENEELKAEIARLKALTEQEKAIDKQE